LDATAGATLFPSPTAPLTPRKGSNVLVCAEEVLRHEKPAAGAKAEDWHFDAGTAEGTGGQFARRKRGQGRGGDKTHRNGFKELPTIHMWQLTCSIARPGTRRKPAEHYFRLTRPGFRQSF
jgi:hypothetical protein